MLLGAWGCDLDGLSGNVGPDGGVDASGVGADGGGGAADGGGVEGGDSAASSPCRSGPQRYCDDFDDRRAPGSSLWTADAQNGGALTIDSFDAVSRPSSLLATLDPTAPAGGTAHLTATMPVPGKKVRVEMQVWLATESTAKTQLCRFFQISSAGVLAFELDGGGGVRLHTVIPQAGQPPLDQTMTLAPFPLGRWVKLIVEVTLDTAAGAALISADGKTLLDLSGVPTQGGANGDFAVMIGADGTAKCRARFDDVLVF